jgi:rSAM/selenodomain-associated transferase 2
VTISVVIPVLNEAEALPVTLGQVAELGFDEILVVDGGSTDRTPEIVQNFAYTFTATTAGAGTRSISLLTAATGRARQMNAGAAISRSEVLLFLHADTSLPSEARLAIQKALQSPDCPGGRFDVRFDEDGMLSRLIGRVMNARSRWSGIATGDQALFVRREVFEGLGGFADIPIMEDVDFCQRLKGVGPLAALKQQAVTSYRRWRTRGPIRTIILMWVLRLLYWLGISPYRLHTLYGAIR